MVFGWFHGIFHNLEPEPKTGNRNLLVRQFKCNALDPTWSNPWRFRFWFPSSLLIFFRSHPGWKQFCWNPRILGEPVGFLGPQALDQAAFQVLFLAPRLVHVSWNPLLWLVLRRGSSLSEKRHLLHLQGWKITSETHLFSAICRGPITAFITRGPSCRKRMNGWDDVSSC